MSAINFTETQLQIVEHEKEKARRQGVFQGFLMGTGVLIGATISIWYFGFVLRFW